MEENRPSSAVPTVATSGKGGSLPSDEATLCRFVRFLPAAVAMVDPELRLRAWSERWGRLVGLEAPPGDAPADDEAPAFFDLVAEHPPWPAALRHALEGEAGHGTAVLQSGASGAERWVDWEVRPWHTAEGAVGGVLLAFVDQTPRWRAEDRFRALADTIDEGFLLMSRSGVFQACNARAEEILGRSAEAVLGSSFRDAQWRGLCEDGTPLPNESFPFWVARYTGEPVRDYEMGIYPPEGPPRWIRVNAQPLFLESDDEPYAVLASFADVTEQKLSEEALRASRDLLSSVLASSLDGIMVLAAVRDETGAIVDFEWLLVNPKAEELVGRSGETLIGRRLLEEMPGNRETGLFDAYVEVVETGEPFEHELFYEHEGLAAWFQIMAVKLNDGVAVTFRDISARKRATQAMAAANAELEQRNQTLREFAYIASHDLQEPLRKIAAFADLMREDYGAAVDETGAYYLERMQDAARRMSTLINDLLAYSRITTQTQPFEPVDLNEVLDEVRSDLDLRIREVDGRVEAGELPTIEADPTQMRQLLQNLVGNALKFHREGVPPVVRVAASVERAEATAEDEEAPLWCRLRVQDNGIGMEEKYTSRIFTPFKRLHGRSRYPGTGIGLAICQRIVQRHGGRIAVASTPGEGTTFTVTLPVSQNGADRAGRETTASPDSTT